MKYAVKSPKVQEIERAARRLGITGTVIEPNSHPAHWFRREGRLSLEWDGSKEAIIRKIAKKMAEKK